MAYQTITLTQLPRVAVVSLNQPSSGNRIDRRLLEELREAVARIVDDGEARAVVLSAEGADFCLGWDGAFLEEIRAGDSVGVESGILGTTFQFLAGCPMPVIAAVQGNALSAGFELALACDVRLAAQTAGVGLPDIEEGRIPMAGGTQRLARLAGRGLAVEMILTGRKLTAAEARAAGIFGDVVEPAELAEAARRLAATIAARGPLAVRLAKEAVHNGLEMPLQQALRYETDLTVLLQTTDDRAEGVRAFMEKREPHFDSR